MNERPAPTFGAQISGKRTHDYEFRFGKLKLVTSAIEPALFYATFMIGEYDGVTVRQGDVVLDAGANIGDFTVKAARAAGSSGRVVAVEPNPEMLPYLRKNIELNQLENVTIVESALSDSKGHARISGVGGSATILNEEIQHTLEVETTTIDDLVQELALPSISVMKMDIEGAEAVALPDQTTLEQVRELAIELHGPTNIEQIPEMLSSKGFSITEFNSRKMIHNIVSNILMHAPSFIDAELKTRAMAIRSTLRSISHLENPNLPLRERDKLKVIYGHRSDIPQS